MWAQKDQKNERAQRVRGWIIRFLYAGRPQPVEMGTLMRLLDQRNFPLSRRRLAEEVDYLRSLRLVAVFPSCADKELDNVAQTRWVQRYAESESDEEMGDVLCVRITTAGINFQDGVDYPGAYILRVD